MALNFDLRTMANREDWDAINPEYQDALILRMMAVGMRKVEGVVEVQEYFMRNAIYTAFYGGLPVIPSLAKAVDGLKTNVTQETSLQWRKRITEQFMLDQLRTFSAK